MAAGWAYKDPILPGYEPRLPNTQAAAHFDATWWGIRKGGRRWHALQNGVGAVIRSHTPEVVGHDYQVTISLTGTSGPDSFVARGITNNKRYFNVVIWDSTAATSDGLAYVDLDGKASSFFLFSDTPTWRNRALVYLNHDFYVIQSQEDASYDCVIYDARGQEIRRWTFPMGSTPRGITTDGHSLYVTDLSGGHTLKKFDVRGNLIYSTALAIGSEDEQSRWPITFNGRYLIINTF